MKQLTTIAGVTLLLVALAAPASAQLWGLGASSTSEDSTPKRLPAAQADATYNFHPTSTTITRSRHFDLAKDTPSFTNAGQVRSPGGTCYGISYMTQYWYEHVVYQFLGLGESVEEPDLGVPQIRAGDTATFESKRLKTFTGSSAGRDRFQRLAASAHDNQHEWGNGASRGDPEETYEQWLADVGNVAHGFGFVSMRAKDDAWGHAVLVMSAQEGEARASGATSGPRVTKFRILDSNSTYASASDHDDEYFMYFHGAEHIGASPAFNAGYGNNVQDGAFMDDGRIGHRNPYGIWARWNATCEDTTQGADIQWGGASSGTRKQNKRADECALPERSW